MRYKTFLNSNEEFEGECIEFQIIRSTSAKEPIESVSPPIYTPRSAGVLPEYDIRTDRWEIAQKAMDMVGKSYLSKRDNYYKSQTEEDSQKNAKKGSSEETSGHAADLKGSSGN